MSSFTEIGVDASLGMGSQTVTKKIITYKWCGPQNHKWSIPLMLNKKFNNEV